VCCVLRAALYFVMWLIVCVADSLYRENERHIGRKASVVGS
jgi:hypothetical protein